MTFHFIVTVWGNEYVELFLNLCLPNQLAPGGLPAFCTGDVTAAYIIYTTGRDRETILGHPRYRELASLMPVEIHTVDFLVASSDSNYSVSLMTRCHQMAIPPSAKAGAALVFLPPDQVYSEGALARLIDIARTGKRVVLLSSVRVRRDTFRPAFEAAFSDGNGHTRAPVRRFVALGLQHQHPMTESYRVDSNHSNGDTNQLYWPVGDEGFVATTLVSHPLMVKPRNLDVVPTWVLDGDYPMKACPNFRDYHFVKDSDELFGFELSPPDKRIGIPDRPRKFSVFSQAVQALHSYNRMHRRIGREVLRIHTGEMDERWDAVEARARRTAQAMRLLVASARRRTHHPLLFQTGSFVNLDYVRRVVIFGAGAGGTLAKRLADRCGWEIIGWVDNDPATWGQTRHGTVVTRPADLQDQAFDLVIVASGPGKSEIFAQLDERGLRHREQYIYFRDPVLTGGMRVEVVG
jgi:hypothetical protein